MLYTSEAIVLKKLKYSENSSIVHLFTEKHGHQVFLSSRSTGKKKQTKAPLVPLSIIEIEAYLSQKKTIQRLKAYNHILPFHSIPFHPVKNAIALFLSEIYWTCSNEEGVNQSLFNFFKTSIQYFDIIELGISNFHLKNLLDLSRLLGFSPENNYSNQLPYFNYFNGRFQALPSNETTNKENGDAIASLLNTELSQLQALKIHSNDRSIILDELIIYFKIHLAGFKVPKSIDVFREMI